MMQRINVAAIKAIVGRHSFVSLLIVFVLVSVFGIYPDASLFWAHCRIAEWALLLFVSMVFIDNRWLKSFVVICIIRTILVFFQTPLPLAQKAGAAAFISLYYIFLFAILYQLLINKVQRRDTALMINALCVIALLQVVYIFFQHFSIDPFFRGLVGANSYEFMDVKDLVVGTWGHTNLSGAYLACSVPLFLRKRWFCFLPLLFVALFWGRSWGAIVSCAVAIIFWIAVTQRRNGKIILLIIAILSTVLYGVLFEHKQFNPLTSDRVQYAKPTIQLIAVRPLIGWGLGQYKNAFHGINKAAFHSTMRKSHAHFEFLELLFEVGSVAGLCVIGFLATLFFLFFKYKTTISVVAMSGIVAMLVNSCSTFTFHTPMAWIFLIYVVVVKKEAENAIKVHRT